MSNRRLGEPLMVFESLCAVGNALALLRDEEEPCSDRWTALTCLVIQLDVAIDMLVRHSRLEEETSA